MTYKHICVFMHIRTHVPKAAELEPSPCEDNTHTHAQLNLREKNCDEKACENHMENL